ncbi:MAG: PQQ-binding-like beta-propeller repeat protein [Verrucomicrobiota bacterium]|nr:PQQ-binding-like beta-propeller repeat protein [Verrucomicrobiota bacterium]
MTKLLIAVTFLMQTLCLFSGTEWNQFRGKTGQGHASAKLPIKWSKDSPNLLWRTEINGKAWSSPILVNGLVVITNSRTSTKDNSLELEALAMDGKTGMLVWKCSLFSYPNMPRIHRKNSYASPTPFFDGLSIFVHFGNLGTASLTPEGKIRWKKVFSYSPVHGSGSSPVVHDDLLLFSADGANDPAIYAINKIDGSVRWKKNRSSDSKKNFSFCTPLVVPRGEDFQIISPASDYVFSYSLNGNELWKSHYPGGYSVVPRPVFSSNMIFVSSGYDLPTLYAIKTDGTGDVTGTKVVWKTSKLVPRNSSVVIVDDLLFMAADNGVVSCLDVFSGSTHWNERVGGSCSASLLHADNLIYLTDETGKTVIFKAKKEFEKLAVNDLGERSLASLMAWGETLVIRTEEAIYRFGEK